jgi:Outer membrane protein beta-barrel domain
MKKHLFLLVLASLILTLSSADAQKRHFRKSQPKFGFGVQAGLNYASQSTAGGSPNVDVQSIIGINGGAYCNYFLFDFLAIQPELMVSGKGVHWKDQYYDANDILTYLDIPILIKYQPVKLINIHVGPEFGYRISAVQKNLETKQKTDIKDYYKSFDVGLAFGVEANLSFKVNLTIRYVLGLAPVTTNNQYNEPWKNNYFQISAGYRILGR